MPRTASGQPDLQGVWSFQTGIPFERPEELKDKAFFTEADAAEWERGRSERLPEEFRQEIAATGELNAVYADDQTVRAGQRTSQVVDPPDGKIPSRTEEAKKRAAADWDAVFVRRADGPEDLHTAARCLVWGAGPPMVALYQPSNALFQLFQTTNHVAILVEMIHDARIIPLDGRPHLPADLRLWLGDSRGWWEGDTLVVETTNFNGKAPLEGSSENLKVTE